MIQTTAPLLPMACTTLYTNILWSTVSNDALKSSRTSAELSPLSEAEIISNLH